MSGMISGGWEYVAAAWGISLSVLVAYAVMLNARICRLSTRCKKQ